MWLITLLDRPGLGVKGPYHGEAGPQARRHETIQPYTTVIYELESNPLEEGYAGDYVGDCYRGYFGGYCGFRQWLNMPV